MNLQVYTQTQKPDQTKININEFDMAKSAAQLLYGPIFVFVCRLTKPNQTQPDNTKLYQPKQNKDLPK